MNSRIFLSRDRPMGDESVEKKGRSISIPSLVLSFKDSLSFGGRAICLYFSDFEKFYIFQNLF